MQGKQSGLRTHFNCENCVAFRYYMATNNLSWHGVKQWWKEQEQEQEKEDKRKTLVGQQVQDLE